MSETPANVSDAAVLPPLRLNPNAPEIYVDGYQGATYKDGIVKLNFYSLTLDPETNVTNREVVMRLTLSVGTVLQVQQALGMLVNDMEHKGILRRA